MNVENAISNVVKASNFAAVKHKMQRRKDVEETPYINHPLGVAYILVTEGKICDLEVIEAAILHDTIEDTDTTFDEIEKEFGSSVKSIVAEVSDDRDLPYAVRKQLQIEHAASSSTKAKLVKLADKLYNLRDLQRSTPKGWTEERVQEYFVWASEVVKRLQGTNKELEEALEKVFNSRGIQLHNSHI